MIFTGKISKSHNSIKNIGGVDRQKDRGHNIIQPVSDGRIKRKSP